MRAQARKFTIRKLFQPTKVPAQNSSDKARSVSVQFRGPAQLGRYQPCAPGSMPPRQETARDPELLTNRRVYARR